MLIIPSLAPTPRPAPWKPSAALSPASKRCLRAAGARRLHAEIVADTGRMMEAARHQMFFVLASRSPVAPFSDIADSRLGKMLSQISKKGAHSRPYLRNANVLWDDFRLDDVYEMDFLPGEQAEFMLQPGDLLICEGGEIGRAAVWKGQIEECYFQKALHRVRLKDSKSSPRYLMHFMGMGGQERSYLGTADGFRNPSLNRRQTQDTDVIWPEPTVQQQ
ncbi:hypothetical protein [Candidatus Amarolinea dominans]|uniref:hypothetical protein n=1 Tax=Candidatus Amarolinea dominans TaxID=3140696 RepID=UPI001D1FB2A5|nr:hypothetical protein [Anaerolineae bacterium]